MKYDNSSYWLQMHRSYQGTLRSVGYSSLSEEFNRLKYASEAETVLAVFEPISADWLQRGKERLSILDVGAGTGYWSSLLSDYLQGRGLGADLTCVDISQEALSVLQASLPHAQPVQADLKVIDVDRRRESADLVFSFYCLHHIVGLDGFLNGLKFAARSVKPEGYLVLMDPILTQHYSPFDVIDFPTYTGNGLPRRQSVLDDILQQEGLRRTERRQAVSFLLNGNIEGHSRLGYKTTNFLWRALNKCVYHNDTLLKSSARALLSADRLLKRRGAAFSSSVCVYKK